MADDERFFVPTNPSERVMPAGNNGFEHESVSQDFNDRVPGNHYVEDGREVIAKTIEIRQLSPEKGKVWRDNFLGI